jgi:acetyl coenzyme A synthetase (ADP forming)-like protein
MDPARPTGPSPDEWEADVVLADGGVVHLRPIRPDDGERLGRFHEALSPAAKYFRFFGPKATLTTAEVEHFCTVDYVDRMAFVALAGDDLAAVARYDRTSVGEAEVAFVIRDADQRRGLGTMMLEFLAEAARSVGISTFTADVLFNNQPMMRVFREAGYNELTASTEAGVMHVEFAVAPTAESSRRIESREHVAEEQSIARILRPRSVAVVGASHTKGTIGYHLFLNLLAGGFDGPVYAVNPHAPHVASVPTFASVLDVPGPIDLAVIAVPAPGVAAVVRSCVEKGVQGLVVISAGFAETGEVGQALELELLRIARAGGVRMVGPNCMGVANTAIGLNATFAPTPPLQGRVAFLSQSGALGIALLDWTARLGIGISSFVSVGNKADVSGNDLLQYWEDDTDTDVILLYLESFGNPRKFSRIARRLSMQKPIVAVKSGRTVAGTRAASSHTAAAASPDAAVDALFHQTGVIRVDTLAELFDMADVLASQPLPEGDRVAIVGNSGGPGILAADACTGAGLDITALHEETQQALRSLLGSNASVSNPVDMVASATPAHYETAIRLVLTDPNVDAVIVIFTPPLVTRADDVAEAVASAAEGSTKPVIANFLASRDVPPALQASGDGTRRRIPSFTSPEPAAIALGRAARYARWRRRDLGSVAAFEDIDHGRARALVAAALGGPVASAMDGPTGDARSAGRWLDIADASELVECYGIKVAGVARVADDDEAVAAAERLGYPVAVKASPDGVVHKSDVGAIVLGLEDAGAVRAAFAELHERFGPDGNIVVQAMASPGTETIVGVVHDAGFGPLVMFGMGGVATELLADRSFRMLPLTDTDAKELVRSLRASPLLFGYRNTPVADVAALEALILRVGVMAEDLPELAELDLNPVIISSTGAVAVDVKVRLTPVGRRSPDVRALRARS